MMLKTTVIVTLLICLSPFSSAYPGSPNERTSPFDLKQIWDKVRSFGTIALPVDCVWADRYTRFTLGATEGWQERCRDPELKKALEQCGKTEIEMRSESCVGTVEAKDMRCTPKMLTRYLQSRGLNLEIGWCRGRFAFSPSRAFRSHP